MDITNHNFAATVDEFGALLKTAEFYALDEGPVNRFPSPWMINRVFSEMTGIGMNKPCYKETAAMATEQR